MIIKQKIGNTKDIEVDDQVIDYLELEWYETSKRILHKKTATGKEIILKFLNQQQNLSEGDILFQDAQTTIVVTIRPCECIVVKPNTMFEMAIICYEIGNKHLPLFYNNDELMIPYEAPLFRMLEGSGFNPRNESRKLLNQLKTTVSAHSHVESKGIFSRILQLTSNNE